MLAVNLWMLLSARCHCKGKVLSDPSPPLSFAERSLSPLSKMSPPPVDDSYQPTPILLMSNDDRELPEANMSSMGEFNSIN